MRLVDYMKLSSDTEEESVFRSLNIGIVNEDKYVDIIKKISEKHQYITESLNIVSDINRHLNRYYSGKKYKYGFCIDDNKSIDDIKLNKKEREMLYKKYYNANNKFEQLKKQFESEILYKKYIT